MLVWGGLLPISGLAHEGLAHDIERVSQALAEDPDRVDLLLRRARYYQLDGHPDQALGDVERARKLDPTNPQVALQSGLALAALGRNAEAETELTRAIDTGAEGASAYRTRARIRVAAAEQELGLADFNAAIALHPTVDLYLERGLVLESLGRWEDAAAGYREGLEKVGRAYLLRRSLISAERARGRNDEALRLIDEELATGKLAAQWQLERAEVLQAMGRPEAAQRDRERALAKANAALRRRPTAIHLVTRARVYLALGQPEAARRDLDRALQRSPQYEPARALRAELETAAESR